jgi:tight adherence protein B
LFEVFTCIATSLAVGTAATLIAYQLFFGKSALTQTIQKHFRSWNKRAEAVEAPGIVFALRPLQLIGVPFLLIAALLLKTPKILFAAVLLALLPGIWMRRAEKNRRQKFENDLDGFLVSLADSLTAVPNLFEALASLYPGLSRPIQGEVGIVLAEIRMGQTIDDALLRMAKRVQIHGLDAAVGALILSRRVGGDIPKTLRRIAETIREMARLEGVIKSKTAEGRTQALVIGIMPPALIFYFEKVNPEWLAPMWNEPLGWVLLSIAAINEIIALVIIRKIMAVDI